MIVDTEKVLREADGSVSYHDQHTDGKVFAPGCASKNRTVRAGEEPEEHKRNFLNWFTLLQMDRLQLTTVYCDRRGV